MAEIKLTYRNSGGVRRTIIQDTDDPEHCHVYTEQDVTSLIENNRRLADEHPRRSTNKLLARAPIEVFERSILERWDEDDWKKWLNDPANKHLRVWPGKV